MSFIHFPTEGPYFVAHLTKLYFTGCYIQYTTFLILRLGIEEAQKQQQRQILLGPGAAMSGGAGKAQQNAPLPTVG